MQTRLPDQTDIGIYRIENWKLQWEYTAEYISCCDFIEFRKKDSMLH